METIIHEAYFSKETRKKSTHYHDCHQLIFVARGSVEVTINETPYTATPGSIVIFNRFENHSINILTSEYERYVLRISPFSGNTGKIYALLANRPKGFRNVLNVSDAHALVESLFKRIIQEAGSSEIMKEDMLQLLINELLIVIYRRIDSNLISLDAENTEYIYELQRRFETQYAQAYTLEALAEEYNISPSSLSHQFKKVTGASVMDYLLSCRMASAKKYLTDTHISIGEIVELCGFSDNSNFSRTFKKLNGISPSAFREQYRI